MTWPSAHGGPDGSKDGGIESIGQQELLCQPAPRISANDRTKWTVSDILAGVLCRCARYGRSSHAIKCAEPQTQSASRSCFSILHTAERISSAENSPDG